MVTRERRLDRGKRDAHRNLTRIGDELREARLSAGLTQRQAGSAAGISPSELSRIELGVSRRVPYESLVILGSILGLDLPIRAYPSGEPVRDAAQLQLLGDFACFCRLP